MAPRDGTSVIPRAHPDRPPSPTPSPPGSSEDVPELPFYLILNVAIAGHNAPPAESECEMVVDVVRVYQKRDGSTQPKETETG